MLELQRRLSIETSFDVLMEKVAVLAGIGDEITQVCSSVSSPLLHDLS